MKNEKKLEKNNFSAWTLLDFKLIWGSQAVSNLGTAIHNVALPIIAIQILHASAFEVSILSAARYLPNLLFSISIGYFIDRSNHKKTIVYSDLVRSILILLLPVFYYLEILNIQTLIIISFLIGTARIFFDVALSALFPLIVPEHKRLSANSNLELISSINQITGPGIGGIIINYLGAIFALIINGVSFVISALFISKIHQKDSLKKTSSSHHNEFSFLDGFYELISRPMLLGVIVVGTISNFALMAVQAVYFVISIKLFGFTPFLASTLLIASGAGSLIGNILAVPLARYLNVKLIMVSSIILMIIGSILMYKANGSIFITATIISLGYFVWGLCLGLFNILSNTYRQKIVPPDIMGRLMGAARTLIYGSMPLGALAGGLVVEIFGLREIFIFNAVINCFSLLILIIALKKSPKIELN